MQHSDVVALLIDKVALISNQSRDAIDPELSLADNGINSLGFVELILAIEHDCGVKLMDNTLTGEELSSLNALAKKIIRLRNE